MEKTGFVFPPYLGLWFLFWGFLNMLRLCYILVPDNNHCMGFSGFLGFFQPNPQTRNPYPKNILTIGKRKAYVLISQEKER